MVLLHLKKFWPGNVVFDVDNPDEHGEAQRLTLYEQIKRGIKKVEYRWLKEEKGGLDAPVMRMLCRTLTAKERAFLLALVTKPEPLNGDYLAVDITRFLKVHELKFVTGYPKGSVPRLEVKVSRLEIKYDPPDFLLQIHLAEVKEVVE